MKQSLTRNLAIGFGFSLLILLGSSVASYISIQNLLNSSQWVNHTYEVVSTLNDVVNPIHEAETSQRGFLITNDPEYLEPFHGAFEESLAALERVKMLTTDNPSQQISCDLLRSLINKRFGKLENLIRSKQETNLVDTKLLLAGKNYMDSIVVTIDKMKNSERELLALRTRRFDTFSRYTPAIIILSSIFSVLIAVFFYIRVRNDINERVRLQRNLEEKDSEISHRIQTVSRIAASISSGDYSTRINDDEKDNLGSLSSALNKMGDSLEYSFKQLSDKEWLQTGTALISETIIGEQSLQELNTRALQVMADYSQSSVGALYLNDGNHALVFSAGYAFFLRVDGRQENDRDG